MRVEKVPIPVNLILNEYTSTHLLLTHGLLTSNEGDPYYFEIRPWKKPKNRIWKIKKIKFINKRE